MHKNILIKWKGNWGRDAVLRQGDAFSRATYLMSCGSKDRSPLYYYYYLFSRMGPLFLIAFCMIFKERTFSGFEGEKYRKMGCAWICWPCETTRKCQVSWKPSINISYQQLVCTYVDLNMKPPTSIAVNWHAVDMRLVQGFDTAIFVLVRSSARYLRWVKYISSLLHNTSISKK